MRVALIFTVVFILVGCNRNIPHVYFDSRNSLLYIDSINNPDFYIYSASIYSANGVEAATDVGDTALHLKQYSFKKYVDSVNDHVFSVNVYLKGHSGSIIMYYGDVEDDSSMVEIAQSDL